MFHRTNRRRFLQTTAATGVGFWVAGGLRAEPSKSPNERIAFASIGLGGKGLSDSGDAAKAGDMVAICDIDDNTLKNAGKHRFPKAKQYNDFRKMLDEMGKSIDAVTVSTPDHTHAAAALMAMRMGIHCFCQKPLTHSIYESRLMAKVAKEMNVATQMGNQGTAMGHVRKAAAVLRAGAVGNVKEVHVWTNRPTWPQGSPRPKPKACPPQVKWDLWLGPAPERPYANGYHPFAWRGWWDFGTGALGDMACHTANMAYMALDLRDPIAVQAETDGHNHDSYPKSSKITFEFAALGNRPALNMFWYDGGRLINRDLLEGKPISESGCLVIGDKGKLYSPNDYGGGEFYLLDGATMPADVKYEESPGHFEEWVQAILGGKPAMSNFADYSAALSETMLLGNLAVWVADKPGVGPRVEWDAANMRVTNIPGLEPIIKPAYRDGYTLDAASCTGGEVRQRRHLRPKAKQR
ncbi:MAG: Gfo/Idh/MocA family oxidoreductase [Planctomycetaceae bacterium]|nr:Gfo/Idh/MocA family oxidoreductase [Planctomycetaceae bacterium]